MGINQNEQEKESLNLMSIQLPENHGGEQMIIRHRALNDKQFVVATLGNGPKTKADDEVQKVASQVGSGVKDPVAKKLLQSIKHHLPAKNKKANVEDEQIDQEQAAMKLRFFRLTQMQLKKNNTLEGKYDVDEYVTPESIAQAARACGFGPSEPEMGK